MDHIVRRSAAAEILAIGKQEDGLAALAGPQVLIHDQRYGVAHPRPFGIADRDVTDGALQLPLVRAETA